MVKRAARKLMADAAYRRAAAFWHLRGRFIWALNVALERGRPKMLIHFGIAPGDDLLCTAVLRELTSRGHKKIWMMSNYPEVFEGNADVAQVVPVDHRFRDCATLWGGKYQYLEYARFDPQLDRGQPTTRHVIAELCARAGVTGEVAVRPYLHLSRPEKEKAGWANGMIAIQSSGLAAKWPMRNKEWFPERFQEVVNRFKNDCKCVQIGSPNDPLLKNVLDLRGKTSIRESAAILSHARLFVGLEGFVMHLARAVECPAVIVFGGRVAPWQFGYGCNENLYSQTPCAPCWFWNRCDYNRICMENIAASDVIGAIEKNFARPRNELPVDSFTI